MLWRGCSLKNTAFIYGLTVFTGHDTKVMKNSAKSRYKMSNVEVLTNYSIGLILLSQFVLSTIGAINGSYYSHYLREDPKMKEQNGSCKEYGQIESGKIECQWAYYLDLSELSTRWLIYFGTWILIFTNFVPISLNVSLELVKLW
jgi:phospholipid-transporting ATPase